MLTLYFVVSEEYDC